MNDILLIEYLKEKDLLGEYLMRTNPYSKNEECADVYDKFFKDFKELTKNMKGTDKDAFVESLKEYSTESIKEKHFTEYEAKQIVASMWSKDSSGRKWTGERYDMHKAKDICGRYSSTMLSAANHCDVYIALNAQFHDYHCLFKSWFGESYSAQIIESAMTFWFQDPDYTKGSKVVNYFK